MTDYLHDREGSEDTERHLLENRRKFESDCIFLLKLMKQGKRLSAQDVSAMKINDRRLRNLHQSGKCEREWMFNEKNKRTHVEYFIKTPEAPTKEKSQSYWNGFFNNILTQPKMF